jgi:hypothetical protein
MLSRMRSFAGNIGEKLEAVVQALDNQQKQLNKLIELQKEHLAVARDQAKAMNALADAISRASA